MIRPLSEEFQKKAAAELKEDFSRIEHDINNIKDWIRQQPHLNARLDDQWILGFLRGCKYSLQLTKTRMDNYYSLKTFWPNFSVSRDPFSAEIQKILDLNISLPLPKTQSATGPRIIFTCFDKIDYDVISQEALISLIFMISNILLLEDDNFLIAGVLCINDMKNYSLSSILRTTPTLLRNFSSAFVNAFAFRVKGAYFLNAPSKAEKMVNIMKSFMSPKLHERFYVYNEKNGDKICEKIPKEYLPKEYGGNNGSLDEIRECWKKKIESYADWFKEDVKYCTNESLRRGKSIFKDNFGIEGSFRQLNVD